MLKVEFKFNRLKKIILWLSEQHLILQFLVLRFLVDWLPLYPFLVLLTIETCFPCLQCDFFPLIFIFLKNLVDNSELEWVVEHRNIKKKIRVEDNLKIIYIFHSQTLQGKSCGDGKMHVLIFLGNWNWFYSQSLLRIIQKSLTTQFQFQEGYDFQYTYVNVYKDY